MKNKPDIIVSWPTNNDYPLWRLMIRAERERFNKVFVVFTKTYDRDNYEEFVRGAMGIDDITFISSPKVESGNDWRNVAVNAALEQSKADWVWFTEQDFMITDPQFWELVESAMIDKDVIGVDVSGRLHPCSIFAKRAVINKTKRMFGVIPGVLDHFGVFQKDLEEIPINIHTFSDDPKPEEKPFFHFNGLSHNWSLLSRGEVPNYEVTTFLSYLEQCLEIGHKREIEMDLTFYKIAALFISANNALKN